MTKSIALTAAIIALLTGAAYAHNSLGAATRMTLYWENVYELQAAPAQIALTPASPNNLVPNGSTLLGISASESGGDTFPFNLTTQLTVPPHNYLNGIKLCFQRPRPLGSIKRIAVSQLNVASMSERSVLNERVTIQPRSGCISTRPFHAYPWLGPIRLYISLDDRANSVVIMDAIGLYLVSA